MLTRRSLLNLFLGDRPDHDILVQVFLRGGADGLALVPPVAEEAYYAARPTLAIERPDARSAAKAIDLDGRFGIHPALAPFAELYRAGELAIVHAAGSEDQTRSHFEAQDLMERGCPVNRDLASGWIARHLRSLPGTRPALSAVAISDVLPESLRASPGACAVRSVDAFSLRLPAGQRETFEKALGSLYGAERGELGDAARQVLGTLETVDRLRREAREERPGAGDFEQALGEIARLVRADVGLEAACVDLGGWDTHFVQAAGLGTLAGELAGAVASFYREVRERRVVVVVLTEFGRRVAENVSLGTDHGRGSVMFALGTGIRGGKVYGRWPGLTKEMLEDPGDLPVTTDFRDVLGEIVEKRLANPKVAAVFPGHEHTPIGIAR